MRQRNLAEGRALKEHVAADHNPLPPFSPEGPILPRHCWRGIFLFRGARMEARYYRALILRAVLGTDPDTGETKTEPVADEATLAAIADLFADAEEALSVLRAKHYGLHGMGIAATARQVPSRHIQDN